MVKSKSNPSCGGWWSLTIAGRSTEKQRAQGQPSDIRTHVTRPQLLTQMVRQPLLFKYFDDTAQMVILNHLGYQAFQN